MIAAEAVFWLFVLCADIQMSNPGSIQIEIDSYFSNQEERASTPTPCKIKTDEVMGGKNAGTFDGFESIFEPLLCGQLVQTSLSVCKCRSGDVRVCARVKLYSRSRSTVFPLSFCSARACHSAALPTHAQQVPRAKAL